MRSGPYLAVLALMVFAGAPAQAAVCLNRSMTQDEIIEAINAARGCDAAMRLFKDCAYTASGDVQLGDAVEKKCEADFLTRLAPAQKQIYRRELRVCDRKYRNESGTMYRSFEAFCRSGVAQNYSRQIRKAAASQQR